MVECTPISPCSLPCWRVTGLLAIFAAAEGRLPGLGGTFLIWATGRLHEALFPGGAFRQALSLGWLGSQFPKDPHKAS